MFLLTDYGDRACCVVNHGPAHRSEPQRSQPAAGSNNDKIGVIGFLQQGLGRRVFREPRMNVHQPGIQSRPERSEACRGVSAGEKLRLGFLISGQVPVLGQLAVAQAVHVDILAGLAAATEGYRGL